MCCHVRLQPEPVEIVDPFVMRRADRDDGPAQGLCVLVGELVNIQRCRAGQFVDLAQVLPGHGEHRGDDVGDVGGCDR